MKADEPVPLVRCQKCRVIVTLMDLPGHVRRHQTREPITADPVGAWVPLATREFKAQSAYAMRGSQKMKNAHA